MNITNVEIKAKSNRQQEIRDILLALEADFKGEDHQIDTYFNVKQGRLKLREGIIENNLIHYLRENQKGPKQADIILYQSNPDSTLKALLKKALGVWKVIDKKREIYFIENVKFHIDTVKSLGTFVEIEAIDEDGSVGKEKLDAQCKFYLKALKISQADLLSTSYSDMVV